MPVLSFSRIRRDVREAIRDTYGLMWDDTALDGIINEAQREYSLLSGSLVGSFEVTATVSGVCECPGDYIEPVKMIGVDGHEKALYSWRYLDELFPDFREIPGSELRGIITDFDGFGKIRVFPKLPAGTPAGKLYYKRLAAADRIETQDVEAIELHCLYQVFLLTGKGSAGIYYKKFIDLVNRESSGRRGLGAKSGIRRGRFF